VSFKSKNKSGQRSIKQFHQKSFYAAKMNHIITLPIHHTTSTSHYQYGTFINYQYITQCAQIQIQVYCTCSQKAKNQEAK